MWSERGKALFGLQSDAPSPNRDGFLQMLHPDFQVKGGVAPKRGRYEGENGPENGPEPKTSDERQIQIYQPHRNLREPQRPLDGFNLSIQEINFCISDLQTH
jgi:hypothetical protein